MIRSLVKIVLVLAIVVGIGVFVLGYWTGNIWKPTISAPVVDPAAVRAKGAELAQKAKETSGRIDEIVGEGSLTAKIKAKMALDDLVKASRIDVDTVGNTVTLTGIVSSEAERERAVRLAKETAGVREVVDRLQIRAR